MSNAYGYQDTFGDPLAQEFRQILSIHELPSVLPAPMIWLDSSDLSTFQKNESNKISQWSDKSSYANHATQVTPSEQPTWLESQLNGRPVVDFNGSNVLILPSSIYALANGSNTVFIVAKTDIDSSLQLVMGLAKSGITRLDIRYTATPGQIYYQSRNTQTSGITKSSISDTSYGILRGRRSGTTQAISFNGSAEIANENGSDEPDVNAASIGAFNGGTGFFFDGQIAEIIAYNLSLTIEQIQQVESYLSNKWGLSI